MCWGGLDGHVLDVSLTEVHICIIALYSRQEHLSDHLHVHTGTDASWCVLV